MRVEQHDFEIARNFTIMRVALLRLLAVVLMIRSATSYSSVNGLIDLHSTTRNLVWALPSIKLIIPASLGCDLSMLFAIALITDSSSNAPAQSLDSHN